jgi:hypothetical protein
MGAELTKFYQQAKAKGGVPAMIKLATRTRVPSILAETHPDTPEIIKLFKQAMKDLGL